jgi:hypothetical protein
MDASEVVTTVGSWVANAGVRGEEDDVARVTDRA